MSEANKELGKRWFEEVWNQGRREVIREMLAPDALIQEGAEAVKGPEGFYPFFDRMQAAFSDIHVVIHDAIAEADKVCVRWSCTMKHTGRALGITPTDKSLQTTGISILRIANGKFVAGWQNWDMLGLMQQIKGESMAPTYMSAKVGKVAVK
jgi:predicted ester cyclase